MAEHEAIYQRLEKDHREIRSMMKEIAETTEGDAARRRELFARLRQEMISHDRAETEAFYQPLEKEGETRRKAYEGETEHDVLEFLLREVQEIDPADERWSARFQVLQEITEHHLEEEEQEMFGKARKVVSEDRAEQMTAQFNRQKEQIRQRL